MRDHVIDELISAYVDGELEGDELKLVEELLANSTEHLQLFEEFQALRTSMWSLPSLNLPDDFHTRVIGQIDQSSPSPAKKPVARVARDSKNRSWGTVLAAVASLAAVIAFTLMLRPPSPTLDIRAGREVGPYPQVTPVCFLEPARYVLVYDLTVRPLGQQREVIESSIKKWGFGFDPTLKLDPALERELLAIRAPEPAKDGEEEAEKNEGEAEKNEEEAKRKVEAIPYTTDLATPKSNDNDKVSMIYVAGTVGSVGDLGEELKGLSEVGIEVSRCVYVMVAEPKKISVMNRLRDSARDHFAHSRGVVPSDAGQAFRLVFSFEVTNISVPGAAMFPVPKFGAKSEFSIPGHDVAGLEADADFANARVAASQVQTQLNQSRDESDGDSGDEPRGPDNPDSGRALPGHILLIIRNASANPGIAN